MRKFFALILAIMLILSMAVTASACTPRLKIPSIKIPEIKNVEIELPQSVWDNHFRNNPIKIDYSKIKFDLDIDWGKFFR